MTISESEYLDILDLIHHAALEPEVWDSLHNRLERLTNLRFDLGTLAAYTATDAARRRGCDLELARRLAPHLARASRVHARIVELTQQSRALQATLDHLSIAVLLLDAAQRVLYSNPAAEHLLRTCDVLGRHQGILMIREGRANRDLHDAVAESANGRATGCRTIRLRPVKAAPTFLNVVPLMAANRLQTVDHAACCAVFASDPACPQSGRSQSVAGGYGLTPAEARLLDSFLSVAGIMQAAEKAGISPATARSHLQRIFEKTGTSSQSELLHLILTATPPLQVAE